MKQLSMLLLGMLVLACGPISGPETKSNAKETRAKEESFDWLLGEWKRLNEAEGKETFEYWQKLSAMEYAGIGFTMANGDTIAQENIRLLNNDGYWELLVKSPSESESVRFKVTQVAEGEFTCENQENDFPKKIRYWKNGDKLAAVVSNTEMEISFDFEQRSH